MDEWFIDTIVHPQLSECNELESNQVPPDFAAEFKDGIGTTVHCVHNEPPSVVSTSVNSA